MRLQKGDMVLVRAGKDKGKTGAILATLPRLNMVLVDGINIVKRTRKPSAKHPRGGIVEEPRPIPASKVGIINPDQKTKTSRIGYEVKGDTKSRVYRQAKNKVIK